MPSVRISDGANAVVDITPNPNSALIKYFKDLSDLSIDGTVLALRRAMSLDDPVVKTVSAGVTFIEPVGVGTDQRSEEHTSELQSPMYLVCRLLLEKKRQVT